MFWGIRIDIREWTFFWAGRLMERFQQNRKVGKNREGTSGWEEQPAQRHAGSDIQICSCNSSLVESTEGKVERVSRARILAC